MATSSLAIKISALVDGLKQIDELTQKLNTLSVATAKPFNADTKNLEAGVANLNNQVGDLSAGFDRAKNLLMGFVAVKLSEEFFSGLIRGGVEFNATLETSKLGIASLIAAQSDLRDAEGRRLSAAEALNKAQGLAEDQVQKLRVAGLQTAATFEQLAQTFQQATGAGLSAGLNLDQIRQATIGVTQAAQALGVPMNQLSQEVVSMLNGTIDMNSRVAKSLGITNQMVQSWKDQGILADELNKKLEVFVASGERIGQTFAASLSNVQEALDVVFGSATTGLFENLKTSFNQIINEVIDTSTGKVKEGAQRTIEGLTTIFSGFGSVINRVISKAVELFSSLGEYLAENKDRVSVITDAVGDLFTKIGDVVGAFVDLGVSIAGSAAAALTLKTVADVFSSILDVVELVVDAFNSLPTGLREALTAGVLFGTVLYPVMTKLVTGIGQVTTSIVAQGGAVSALVPRWGQAKAAADAYRASAEKASKTTFVKDGPTGQGNSNALSDAAYRRLSEGSNQANKAVQSLGQRMAENAKTFVSWEANVASATKAALGLARVLSNPFYLTLIVAGYEAFKVGVDTVIASMEKNNGASKAMEQSLLRASDRYGELAGRATESAARLRDSANVQVKTSEQLATMNTEELASYGQLIAKKAEYYRMVQLGLAYQREQIKAQIEAAEARGVEGAALGVLTQKLAQVQAEYDKHNQVAQQATQALEDFSSRNAEFASRIETGSTAAIKKLVDAFDASRVKGDELSKSLSEITTSLSPGRLTAGGVASVLNALEELRASGKLTTDQLRNGLSDQLKKLGAEDLLQFQSAALVAFDSTKGGAEGAARAIAGLRTALEAVQNASLERLGVDIEKLTTGIGTATQKVVQDINNFSAASSQLGDIYKAELQQIAEETQRTSPKLASLLLEAARSSPKLAKRILDNLDGLSASAESRVQEMRDKIRAEAEKASKALSEAFNAKVGVAKTTADVQALQQALNAAAKEGTIFGDALTEAQNKISDRAREVAGVIEGSLGDSFKRAGVKGQQALSAVAEQARVDFDRIKASGLATNGELVTSINKWRDASVEAAKSASTGPLEVSNAYMLAKTQISNAITGLGKSFSEFGVVPVNELRAALANTSLYFERLRASGEASASSLKKAWQDYAQRVIEANGDVEGTFLRVKAASEGVTLQLDDAWGRMGVKTRAELGAVAEQATKDFQTIASSGQATTDELGKAFEKYAESVIAANGGLDSNTEATLRNAAAQAGLGDTVDTVIEKFKGVGDAAKGAQSEVAAHGQSLAGGVAAFIADLGNQIGQVSGKAQQMFQSWLTSGSSAVQQMDELQARAAKVAEYGSRGKIAFFDFTGFGQMFLDMSLKANELEALAIRDLRALKKTQQELGEAGVPVNEVISRLQHLIGVARTLDDSTLDGLKSQLASAKQQLESIRQSALGVVDSLRGMGLGFKEELLRAKGQLVELENLQYKQKLAQLEMQRDQVVNNKDVGQAEKSQAEQAFSDAKSQLDELHQRNLAQAAAEMAAAKAKVEQEKLAAQAAKQDPSGTTSLGGQAVQLAQSVADRVITAPSAAAAAVQSIATGIQQPSKVVEFRFTDPRGNTATALVPESESARLLDILEEVRRRS